MATEEELKAKIKAGEQAQKDLAALQAETEAAQQLEPYRGCIQFALTLAIISGAVLCALLNW